MVSSGEMVAGGFFCPKRGYVLRRKAVVAPTTVSIQLSVPTAAEQDQAYEIFYYTGSGPPIVPVEQCRLPAFSVFSVTCGIDGIHQCDRVWSSAGGRY